jgi:hypothetical protein
VREGKYERFLSAVEFNITILVGRRCGKIVAYIIIAITAVSQMGPAFPRTPVTIGPMATK